MDSVLIVMMGVAGSGKSTRAKEIAEKCEDCVIVSRDEIRFSLLKPGEDYFAHEKKVEKIFYKTISNMLLVHKYVIADATHITIKSRNKLFNNISHDKIKIIGVWVEATEEVAQKQNHMRTGIRRVPRDVITSMFRNRVFPIDTEPFDKIIRLER